MAAKTAKKNKPLSAAQLEQRRNAAKQPRTMTPAAIEQRRNAAALSTGPTTPEGKAASSRNNWKHGMHSVVAKSGMWKTHGLSLLAKPCKSTCEKYPCSLVDDGATVPGQDCMDKQVFVEAFDALMGVLQSGDTEYVHGMMAAEVARTVELLHSIRDSIDAEGVMIVKPFITKDGQPIPDPNKEGKLLGEPIPHPLLTHVNKIMDQLGINLPELMATPRSVLALEKDKDKENEVKDLFHSIGVSLNAGLKKPAGTTYENSTS